jgi:hypothetical protein
MFNCSCYLLGDGFLLGLLFVLKMIAHCSSERTSNFNCLLGVIFQKTETYMRLDAPIFFPRYDPFMTQQ